MSSRYRELAEEAAKARIKQLAHLDRAQLLEEVFRANVRAGELHMVNRHLRSIQNELEDARRHYADLYELSPIAYLTLDRNGTIVESNLPAAVFFNRPRTRLLQHSLFELLAARKDNDIFSAHLKATFSSKKTQVCELILKRPDPTPSRLQSIAVEEPSGLMRCRTAVLSVAAEKRTERSLRMISEVSRMLSMSLDEPRLIADLAEYLTTDFAMWCEVHGIDAQGGLCELSSAPIDPSRESRLRGAAANLGLFGDPRASVIKTLRTLIVPNILERFSGPPSTQAENAAYRYAIIAPLTLSGRAVGTLSLGFDTRHQPLLGEDIVLTEELSRRIALALENARLYRDAQRATALSQRAITLHREAEERFRLLLDGIRDYAIFMLASDGSIATWNAGAESLLGYREEEILGRAFEMIYAGPVERPGEAARALCLSEIEGRFNSVSRCRRRNGTDFIADLVVTPLPGERSRPRGYACVIGDITEHFEAEARVRYLAHHDVLTGLPNRTLFMERLHTALTRAAEHGTQLALMFLDLDRFKYINDTLGHGIGDLLLQKVTDRLRTSLDEPTLLARLGGDEFTVILENLPAREAAAHMAEHIGNQFGLPFQVGDHELFVSSSIGITVFPEDGVRAEDLIKNADVAMYRAKEAGKNNYKFFEPEMHARAYDRLALEIGLRHALARGELVLHYQPQLETRSRELVCVEALLRWEHPELGLLAPDEFLTLLEETGLIVPIGQWVLETACADLVAFRNAGAKISMAVNLSNRQLPQRDLTQKVKELIRRMNFDPRTLELELTETQLMENTQRSIEMIQELKAAGVTFSIDDFGTGYSSLSYLKRFPIDKLKIDRSFVRDLTTDPDDAGIASAIIALAHSLGIKVVAEGVETEEQLGFLRERRCDCVQGFLLGRPVSRDEFLRLHAAPAPQALGCAAPSH